MKTHTVTNQQTSRTPHVKEGEKLLKVLLNLIFFLFSSFPLNLFLETLPAHQGKPTTAQSLPIHHPPPGLGWDRVLARTRQAWEKEALMPEAPEVVATVLQRLRNPMGYSPPGFSVNGILHFLLQGIFLTQESNLSLLCLLHWQMDSLLLSHQTPPEVLKTRDQNLTWQLLAAWPFHLFQQTDTLASACSRGVSRISVFYNPRSYKSQARSTERFRKGLLDTVLMRGQRRLLRTQV